MMIFCVHSEDDFFSIYCEFPNLPQEIIVDENVSTTFEEEYLLNKNGKLIIKKNIVRLKASLKKRFFNMLIILLQKR